MSLARQARVTICPLADGVDRDQTFSPERRGTPIARRFPTIQAILGQAAATTLVAAARDATTAALHVCGAYGLTRDMVVERLYREAVFYDVAQGVAESQQIIVARQLLADHSAH